MTVPAGTAATVVAGEPDTGGAAGHGNAAAAAGAYDVFPQLITKGTPIVLDPAGPLFAVIGAGNLRAYVPGQDDVSHAALSN